MSDVREENIARHHADRGNERAGPNCSLQSMVLRPFHHERKIPPMATTDWTAAKPLQRLAVGAK